MSKARQAAEERYPLNGDATNIAIRATLQTGYVAGRLDALPENPDPAVIEAMAEGFTGHTLGDDWGDDGVVFVGCDCGEWFGKAVDGGWDRAFQHRARAAYAAMRGAMQ